jgi:hypothetical protein
MWLYLLLGLGIFGLLFALTAAVAHLEHWN